MLRLSPEATCHSCSESSTLPSCTSCFVWAGGWLFPLPTTPTTDAPSSSLLPHVMFPLVSCQTNQTLAPSSHAHKYHFFPPSSSSLLPLLSPTASPTVPILFHLSTLDLSRSYYRSSHSHAFTLPRFHLFFLSHSFASGSCIGNPSQCLLLTFPVFPT